jgi:hypothetical protein
MTPFITAAPMGCAYTSDPAATNVAANGFSSCLRLISNQRGRRNIPAIPKVG